jgi:RNA polymerase sigma-70 factor (ECF subfamily)
MDQTEPVPPRLGAAPVFGDRRDLNQLLRQVATGDQQAFELLYQQLSRPAYSVIRRVVRDRAQSEEVTQEVLLEVWRTATRFDPAKGSAATWVLTIAHRRAIDRVRSEVAAAGREQRTAAGAYGPEADFTDFLEASMDRVQIRGCIGQLTALQRESITLAYYDGYTYRQIADLIGVTPAAVKTRIRDGLLRLRDCLGVS